MVGAQRWVWGRGSLGLSSTEVDAAVPGVGGSPQRSQQWDQQVPSPLCPEFFGTKEGAGRHTGLCRGVAVPHASCRLSPGTPCSQRVPGEEAALWPPGRGSQPCGISQGQLKAVTGISVSLR